MQRHPVDAAPGEVEHLGLLTDRRAAVEAGGRPDDGHLDDVGVLGGRGAGGVDDDAGTTGLRPAAAPVAVEGVGPAPVASARSRAAPRRLVSVATAGPRSERAGSLSWAQ